MTKYDQFKCWIKYRLFHKKRTLKQTQEFWNKAEGDNWNKYKEGIGKSKFFHNLIAFIPLSKHTRILELGCNVGRNLNYLRSKGFTNLTGIELNSEAVKNSLKGFKIFNSSIEDYLRNFENKYDLIFTMAALEHLPQESEWIFAEMVKRAKHIITIEDEHSLNKICFPRNYKKIFESLGMKQIYECDCEGVHPTLTKNFRARVFQHK